MVTLNTGLPYQLTRTSIHLARKLASIYLTYLTKVVSALVFLHRIMKILCVFSGILTENVENRKYKVLPVDNYFLFIVKNTRKCSVKFRTFNLKVTIKAEM